MASTNNQRKEFAREDYSPVNVDKWDGGAVKNNLDDTVKIIMKKHYEYTEDFHLVNQRLIICTIACLFSLFSVVYDYYHPFPQSKYILATCSICYFILMGLLTLFMSYKEKNIFTVSVKTGAAGLGPKDYLYISSTLPRYSSEYSLSFEFIDGKTGTTISANLSKSISEWIDVSGDLNLEKFFNDIDKLHSDVTKKKQN